MPGENHPARSRLSLSPRTNTWLILILLALFVGLGYTRFTSDNGDDLAASYIGCRLIASDDSAHLYAHDPQDFSDVGDDDEWQGAADESHFESLLHPYVQTPLWAWSLQPLCTRLYFPAFNHLFTVLALISFAALIWLVARAWAPRLLHPAALIFLAPVFWFSTPFKYSMVLTQTHIFFVLLTVAAIVLAQRGRALTAGTLLALAAAVKLTPAIFLVYWLLTRRYRAAASFVVVSALLLVAARLTAGPALFAEYLATLHRVSNTLLLSLNNQSLAAWWMGHFYPASDVTNLNILPLPASLRLVCTLLMLLSVLAAGLWDRRSSVIHRDSAAMPPSGTPLPIHPPLGALFLLVAATLLTPIAWTHYSIVLLPPLMVLLDFALRRRSIVIALAIALILALNLPPLASNVTAYNVGPHAILRSQFFAGILCLITLAAVALTRRRYANTHPVPAQL